MTKLELLKKALERAKKVGNSAAIQGCEYNLNREVEKTPLFLPDPEQPGE